ncbi:hypothetical protein E2C01_090562 [Portunus trituberculatus]|uniref:Uncharacterized protein n=1 Tax=Portunus trituberculatus TaxID=210409 RepID=A0A5B7JL70_PORTR|nr:hypothetical protein [Portunus trituberculatus]
MIEKKVHHVCHLTVNCVRVHLKGAKHLCTVMQGPLSRGRQSNIFLITTGFIYKTRKPARGTRRSRPPRGAGTLIHRPRPGKGRGTGGHRSP